VAHPPSTPLSSSHPSALDAAAVSAASAFKAPQPASRLSLLPAYVFAYLNQLKPKAVALLGRPLIDLGMGNPDRPTPPAIIEAIAEAVKKPENHGYPDFAGKPSFRLAVANWMQRRYNVTLNPDTMVQPVIGSKEGIFHLLQAYLEPGTVALMPAFHYPAYERGTMLAGAELYEMPVDDTSGLPDLSAIPEAVLQRARILMVNYPNNPTGAIATTAFLEQAVALCRKWGIVLLSDLAYGEITYDGYVAESILNIAGAEDVAIEFHSFSKTFNMAGWRIGFAVGAPAIIKTLYSIKSNLDYGVCNAVQDGAAFALDNAAQFLPEVVQEYEARRNLLSQGFADLGWPLLRPKGAFYLWLPTPNGQASLPFVEQVMMKAGVVITPGSAFGKAGDQSFRVSLVSPQHTLTQALGALREANITYSV
jgi:LL-diaminopimelate aminotransferase